MFARLAAGRSYERVLTVVLLATVAAGLLERAAVALSDPE